MSQNSLIKTLVKLKGNPRAVVYTEPLWGIPFNLFFPFASIYMLKFGISDAEIGAIVSLGLLFQIFFAFISGALTDKFGRRLTTLISDLLSWSLPTLIWAVAQDIRYFVVAAIFNAMWRIPANSWTCLLVEDAEEDQMVHIWTWVFIAAQLSAIFAPLASLIIARFDLVMGVRIMYTIAFVMMTVKAWLLYHYSTETERGSIRLAETKNLSIYSLLKGYFSVFRRVLKSNHLLLVIGIQFIFGVVIMIVNTFWAILATEKIGLPEIYLSYYPFVRSTLLLVFYFYIVPKLTLKKFRNPMLAGLAGFSAAMMILLAAPQGNFYLLLLSVVLEAASVAIIDPLLNALVIVSISPEERARINSILAVFVIALSSPFGWIAGRLSEINRSYPFSLSLLLLILGAILVLLTWNYSRSSQTALKSAGEELGV